MISEIHDSHLKQYQGKRILVTGHTGFKGSWLTLWLYQLGVDVVGYALEPPTTPNMFHICGIENLITSIHGDVRDQSHFQNVCLTYEPEIIFHLAAQALVRRSYNDPVTTYTTNVMGTLNVLEACRNISSVKALVIITSDKCYENREWVWGYREIDALGGYDPYSSSKGCAELVTQAYMHSFFPSETYAEHGKAIATVRAGNVIGGGDWAEDRLIPDCMRAVESGETLTVRYPHATRPWQHVLEPLYGYLTVAQHLYNDGSRFNGAWNFGPRDENVYPVRWLLEYIQEQTGNKLIWEYEEKEPVIQEAHYLKLDCSKAKTELGWRPHWDLQTALDYTIAWYEAYHRRESMLDITLAQITDYEQTATHR